MASYEHSDTFASLKSIREEVKENLTTPQWLSTLDYFIDSAIDPVVTIFPTLVDNFYAKVVVWQAHKPSIKFSMTDKFALPVKLFNAITSDDCKTKREHHRSMLLNRGLLFGLIAVFSQTVNRLNKLHSHQLNLGRVRRLHMIEVECNRLGISPNQRDHVYAALTQVEFFSKKAYWFKELIIQKYVRMALMNAKNAYTEAKCVPKLNDVVQIYLVYLSRAIDRCDSRQGVLTTFIQTWFYSAKAEVARMVNSNSSNLSYEELIENGLPIASTDPDLGFENLQHLAFTSKPADPHGVVRFSLRIPEFVQRADLDKLRIFTTKGKRHD